MTSRAVKLLRHSHQLEHVPVRVPEIDAAPAVPVVELAIVDAPGRAAVSEASLFYSAKDRIEFGIAHMESIMVVLELPLLRKQQGERVVHFDGREISACSSNGSPNTSAKKRANARLSRAGTMVWLRTITGLLPIGCLRRSR